MTNKKPCDKHDFEIAELKKDLNGMGKKFSDAVFGNGKPGVIQTVIELREDYMVNKNQTALYMKAIVFLNIAVIGMLAGIFVKLIFFK